jgi:hypothetical protein
MRDQKEGKQVGKTRKAMCLTARKKELPTHLYYHEMIVEMTVFVPGVKIVIILERYDTSKKSAKNRNTAFHEKVPNTLGISP